MRTIAIVSDAIEELPISLDALKTALRIYHDDLDELLMSQILPAAVKRAEAFMNRAVAVRTHRWILDELPCGADRTLLLPLGNVQSVSQIEVSVGGVVTTLLGPSSEPAGTDYQEDLRGTYARLMPARGSSWPVADCDVPSPVVVTFIAGWESESIPEDIVSGLIAYASESADLSPSDQVGTFLGALQSASDYGDSLLSAHRLP